MSNVFEDFYLAIGFLNDFQTTIRMALTLLFAEIGYSTIKFLQLKIAITFLYSSLVTLNRLPEVFKTLLNMHLSAKFKRVFPIYAGEPLRGLSYSKRR